MAAVAAAAANAISGQDLKLTAHLPVLLSARFPTYCTWLTAYNNYCDCFVILQAARVLAIDEAFAAYSVAEKASNSRCRLTLQDALSTEDWDLIAGDERYCVNMHQLNEVYTGAAASDVEVLQFEMVNLAMTSGESLKSYWSRGISIRKRLTDLGETVTEAAIIMWLLAGLPSCWKTFRSIAKHNSTANQGIYQMLRFLQPEEPGMLKESCHKSKQHAADDTHHLPLPAPFTANTASTSFSGVCWRCNKPGHRASDCNAPADSCQHCGRVGHNSSTCFHLHGFPNGRPSRSNTYRRPQDQPQQHQERPRSRSRSPARRAGTPGPSRTLQLPPPPPS